MSGTLATLIPVAIGVAISPAPVIELILVVFSKRRASNSLAFVTALIVSTAAAVALGAAGQSASEKSSGGTSTGVAIVLLALGLLLVLLGVRNWRNRADTSEPKAFQTIAGMGPAAAAFLAFGAVFVNPKNLVLLIAAGQTIDSSSSSSKLLIGALFVILATAPYTIIGAYALIGGAHANANLDRARSWLIGHNRMIMGVICTLLGLVLVGKGIGAL